MINISKNEKLKPQHAEKKMASEKKNATIPTHPSNSTGSIQYPHTNRDTTLSLFAKQA